MPSGKRAKQQRRVAAPPPTKGGAGLGARRASPMVLAIAAAVIVIIVLAVVLAVVLSGGNSNSGSTTTDTGTTSSNADPNGDLHPIGIPAGVSAIGNSSSASAEPYSADVAKMFKGIPQHGFVLGQPSAPVTLIEYIDLQCPVCQSFELNELGILVDKYVKTGKIKIEMKPWNIIDANHPGTDDSYRGQELTIAAAKQNLAFTFAEVLYNNQGLEGSSWLTNATAANIAASVDGLKLAQLASDANSAATTQMIKTFDNEGDQASQLASAAGQQPGTPTILLQKGSETPKFFGVGYPSLSALESAINKLLP